MSDARACPGDAPPRARYRVLSLLLLWLMAGAAHAQPGAPNTKELIEKLPERLQGAAQQMADSRHPPARLVRTMFLLPRARLGTGTGTSWQPDASPLYAVIPHADRWGFMIHGNLYTGYDWAGSERGSQRFMGRNTLLGAAFRTFRRSELLLRLALSFEPLTVGERGYPLILQTGQTRDGETRVHDRQYALDFFRELSAMYSWQVTSKWAGMIYLAAAGEPALGPGSFTQRVSASPDPFAPIGLQWHESSHSSFGVLTVGAFTRSVRLEASWFNGNVPGPRRYGIYLRMPDSYSARVTWNPNPAWSAQASYGFLEQPVALDPERSEHRLTVSASHTRWNTGEEGLASTVSLALRAHAPGRASVAALAESYWNIDRRNAVYGRFEYVQKSGIELQLAQPSRALHSVGTLALGYVYYFGPFISLTPGLGLRASVSPLPSELERDYGTRAPLNLMVYAQLRTSALPARPSSQ